jgi:hypothetical protein
MGEAAAQSPAAANEKYESLADDSVGGMPAAEAAPPPPAPMAPPAAPTGMLAQNHAPTAPVHGKKPDAPTSTQATSDPKAVASDVAPISQMLIYTATLNVAVYEVNKSLTAVEELARQMGGFLAMRSDRQITIRVPVARFDDTMKKLEGQGDVLHRDVKVEDVTEQFLDVMLRLRNARQVRERIVQLLAESKTVQDSLAVERELERLSGEIERLEGRVKFLRDRALYSTITVSFEAIQVSDVKHDKVFQLPFPWLSDLGLGRLMNLR